LRREKDPGKLWVGQESEEGMSEKKKAFRRSTGGISPGGGFSKRLSGRGKGRGYPSALTGEKIVLQKRGGVSIRKKVRAEKSPLSGKRKRAYWGELISPPGNLLEATSFYGRKGAKNKA